MICNVMRDYGTTQQRAFVKSVTDSPGFAKSVDLNHSKDDIPAFTRRTVKVFTWFDKDGNLHVARVGVTGRILQRTTAKAKCG